jgi:succinoglycan biosynthesis protein ExoM
MIGESNHVCVCICTFKRPELLKRLLDRLQCQTTQGLFGYSLVIADNDLKQSAKDVVLAYTAASKIEIAYCLEPEQNIALARNKALERSKGNFVAFIDDDEIPQEEWLYNLYTTCTSRNVDGVLGPVRPYFDHVPPRWVTKGKFFDRPEYHTGYKLSSSQTRTGNVLFKREIITGIKGPFRAEFRTGSEDIDFFKRMVDNGRVFIWCKEAAVYELIPPARCKRVYQIKKALLNGANSLKYEHPHRALYIIKSLAAIPIYILSLPLLGLAANHLFMKYVIKLCDHVGKMLQLLGINPVKDRGL